MGKQPVAWKEYCAEFWFKKLQKSMDRCTDRRDITELLLKTPLNTIQSINHSRYNTTQIYIRTHINRAWLQCTCKYGLCFGERVLHATLWWIIRSRSLLSQWFINCDKSNRWKRWRGICQVSQVKKWVLWKKNHTNSIVWRTSPHEQGKGLTIWGTYWFGDELRQVTKSLRIIVPKEWYSGYRYFRWKKDGAAIIDALFLFIFIRCCKLYI